jgi:hypothetical protein
MRTAVALACVSLWLVPTALAQQCGATHTDDFSAQNQGNWHWGGPFESIAPTGGFPAAYLSSIDLDTFAPILSTTGASVFTGNYRTAGVTSLGVDLQTFDLDFPTSCQRPLSLVLENDNGTPNTVFDDVYVYFLSPRDVPCMDGDWHSFSVDVPSQSSVLPAGWSVDPNATSSPNAVWNQVIASVSKVRWFYGDPTNFFIFQMWDVGADNPRISFAGGASAYCLSQRNSAGCQPRVESSGSPSASSSAPFLVTLDDALNQKSGLYFYGLGAQYVPYQGGKLCIAPPTRRTALQNSGGSPSGSDCSGAFSFDFNARIQSGLDPALVPGVTVYGQYWSRDPASAALTNFSNAIQHGICP